MLVSPRRDKLGWARLSDFATVRTCISYILRICNIANPSSHSH